VKVSSSNSGLATIFTNNEQHVNGHPWVAFCFNFWVWRQRNSNIRVAKILQESNLELYYEKALTHALKAIWLDGKIAVMSFPRRICPFEVVV
jgi:hypothetical protein